MAQTLSARRRILAVVGGGFCGTILRVLLSALIQSKLGKGWPYDILTINVTGAFLLAFLTTLADATMLIGPTRRLFLNVGLLGAYTTFSSLALGDFLLIAGGHWLPALGYLVFSGLGGIAAILLGNLLGQWCVNKVRNSLTKQENCPGHHTIQENQEQTFQPDQLTVFGNLTKEKGRQT